MSRARISSLWGKITIFMVICCCSLPAQAKYGGGTGEPNDPYLIYDANQMNAIGADSNDWDKHFKLMADIDLSAFTGTEFNIIGEHYYDSGWVINPFTGVFDGNGKKISNFTYDSNDTNYIGLFGCVGDPNAEIKDLGLIDPNVDAGTGNYVGSLVGRLRAGTITNCYVVRASVSGGRGVGGLVGGTYYSTITNCYSTGSVSGSYDVGGLVGRNEEGTITNCYSTASVSGIAREVGGLVGGNWHGTITNCYSTGSVSGSGRDLGGLVGFNQGTITDCYSTGSVSGTTDVGGLVGKNYYGTISNCYSIGSVSGTANVGGLVGYNYKGAVITSFWDIETSGQSRSSGGTGLPTEEMQKILTFTNAGWDFVGETTNGTDDIWIMIDYPKLAWQLWPPPPVADAGGPYSIYVGDTLALDASGSTDDDNDIVSYMWDLDDDESFETDAGGQAIFDVNYTYLQSLGLIINYTYNIHVQVTDSEGQSDVADSTLIIVPKPAVQVAVDIKPSSCPNPLNVKSSGVLPIAILGTVDYDVTTIDPTSIRLAGVEPLRSGYEDVATPVTDANDCNCTEEGPDGFLDLTLKFETQKIVEAIGDVNDGDVRVLTLTGVLFDPIPFETPIEGADCILIRGRHKPINPADINKDGVVNVADFAIFAQNWLQSSIVDE